MKIALSSLGKDINSNLSEVFGRCPYFVIVEISTKGGSAFGGEDKKVKGFEAIENTSANQMGGAGISAARMVAEENVAAVISGNIGPRALEVLRQFNIEVYKGTGLVKEVIESFIEGELEKIKKAGAKDVCEEHKI